MPQVVVYLTAPEPQTPVAGGAGAGAAAGPRDKKVYGNRFS